MRTWFVFMIPVMVVMDAIALHRFFFRIRPRLMKPGRTMAQRKETLAAAGTIVGGCLRESCGGDPDTLPAATSPPPSPCP